MLILGLTKTTLLDYPEHVAATLFTGGCNFRCPYCHNRDIILQSSTLQPLTDDEIFSFLRRRQHVLSGVCITGGEPTLYQDLPALIRRIRALGYLVKLDTNGSNPQMLCSLIQDKLIDYCAMDIKNAPEKYAVTAGCQDLSAVKESVQLLLCQQTIPYEFRTTLVAELHSKTDLTAIARWISGANAYYLQSYMDSEGVLCPGFHAPSAETLQTYADLCRQYVPNTFIRGDL
ncbi:MAG: anaerobic ribonucleoside-triphosphate reductase activating protein [Lachnospiraceae bacterium]|nr:anaerobic ribonucleoside-triphosphate reductase activating protein [Lachnospiraceae bacterium]MDE7183825.1 anaerobic ribonucleoside-triphosphate reductase activating protein [Lachnospiraceae bacterium]